MSKPSESILAQPLVLGPRTIANRLVMTPHVGRLPTHRFMRYLAERAGADIGMIILPVGHATFMHRVYPDWIDGGPQDDFDFDMLPPDQATPEGRTYFDKFAPMYKAYADIVHRSGGTLIGQIHHPGPEQTWDGFQPSVAASAVRGRNVAQLPHALTARELQHLAENYALTARRVAAAGLDGIEVHAAHGYLLNQFLSAATNQRSDAYGGPLQNRLRLLREILAAIRAEIGNDLLLGVRLPAGEGFAGGLGVDDVAEVIQTLTPLLNYVSVSAGTRFGTWGAQRAPAYTAPWLIAEPPAVDAARQIRARIALPLLVTGRINSAATAAAIVESGAADMVGMARQLIADPAFARKVLHGGTVNQCIACNECTLLPFSCPVNPAAGREAEADLRKQPAAKTKHVVIVGAGPAGMEAAVAAAQRGHRVTLLEQAQRPGGALRDILNDPVRAGWRPLLERLERDLDSAAVTLHCGVRADADRVLALAPDAVLVATGSTAAAAEFSSDTSVQVTDSRSLWRDGWPARRLHKILVVGGQDRHIEPLLAALQAARCADHVLLLSEDIAPGLDLERRALNELTQRLHRAGVISRGTATVGRIESGQVVVRNLATGAGEIIDKVDLVVTAHGRNADDSLLTQLEGRVDAWAIGDALAPRRFTHAILEGARFGASL